jgi:hypothetical protein
MHLKFVLGVVSLGILGGFCFAEGLTRVTIVAPYRAELILNDKPAGVVQLPLNRDYELLGVIEGRFLLQQGAMRFIVDPLATDYGERPLLRRLGWTDPQDQPSTIPTSEVIIYQPEPSPLVIRQEARKQAEMDAQELQRPLRQLRQDKYSDRYFYREGGFFISGGLPYYYTPYALGGLTSRRCEPEPSAQIRIVIRP